jgi:hypothetical protein
MNLNEYITYLKKLPDYKDIEEIFCKKDVYSFLVGDKCSKAKSNEWLRTSPDIVTYYLHIFLSDGTITNDEINEALKKLNPDNKENVWLILLYIEAQLLYTKHRKEPNSDFGEHLVDINLQMLIDKIKSVWNEYKDEYTTKYFTQKIYELTGRTVFEE